MSAPKFTVSERRNERGRFLGYAISDGGGLEEMVQSASLARVIETHADLCAALEIVSACGYPYRERMHGDEGVEGWRWVHPDGREWAEAGSWYIDPPMHPVARAALAKARGEG